MTEQARRSSRPIWLGQDRRRFDHVRVHLQVIHDSRLGAYELACYLGLLAHAEIDTGCAKPSEETLAEYACCSDRQIRMSLKILANAAYIEIEHRPGLSNRYHILPPPPLESTPGAHRLAWLMRTPERGAGVPRNQMHPTPERTPERGSYGQEEQEHEPLVTLTLEQRAHLRSLLSSEKRDEAS